MMKPCLSTSEAPGEQDVYFFPDGPTACNFSQISDRLNCCALMVTVALTILTRKVQTSRESDMKKTLWALSLALGLTLLFTGCSSAPTAEIDAAKAAIRDAQTEEIRSYAPESLKAAEDSLSKALAEVQTQDGKFSMTRDYKQASTLLKSAKDLADKAKDDALAGKAKAKADAEAMIATLPPILEDARKALARAPRGKDTRADLEAMQNDLKLAQEELAGANSSMAEGKYSDALAKADSAKSKASAITDQVTKALEKARGRR